ncbi:MAG: 3-deoxy-D-manno-octulosonic acid kinase, partial [Haemophilus parainfluenzae]|nr:3-deoxy-D-manno-octulosonic acid kinase [Haemophilus parainfluenzae]
MLEFQQDNQFFLFNITEKPTEPASFFESAFWEKQQCITGSAKGRGTTYFLN